MLKKFWLCLSLVNVLGISTVFAADVGAAEREAVDQQTRPFLYGNEPNPAPSQQEVGDDLCDHNNPSGENCNLFQIENGETQSAFQKPGGESEAP
jgi:hypothetical protein